jgi:hypothetical protein
MVSGQPNTVMKELLKKTPKLKLGSLQCTSHLSADKGEIINIDHNCQTSSFSNNNNNNRVAKNSSLVIN